MNKLDKKLIEAINEWLLNLSDGYFQLSKYKMGDDDTTWNAFDEIKKVIAEYTKEQIKKSLPTHPDKMLKRKEVIDIINRI